MKIKNSGVFWSKFWWYVNISFTLCGDSKSSMTGKCNLNYQYQAGTRNLVEVHKFIEWWISDKWLKGLWSKNIFLSNCCAFNFCLIFIIGIILHVVSIVWPKDFVFLMNRVVSLNIWNITKRKKKNKQTNKYCITKLGRIVPLIKNARQLYCWKSQADFLPIWKESQSNQEFLSGIKEEV